MPGETLTTTSTDCEVEVTVVHATADTLRISYKVRNKAVLPLYLFNRMSEIAHRSGAQTLLYLVKLGLVNVQLDAGQLIVSKKVTAIPEWMLVETLRAPCLSRVLPGEVFEEVFELSLPLMPYTIYESLPVIGSPVALPLFI